MAVKASKSTGIANKDNLAGWADYAKKNSYQCDNAELKAKLDAGGPKGRESDWSDDWKQPQKDHEGRGWVKPSATTADNTYTGPGGSKRD